MTSTLFSPLSRGCGSWDGAVEADDKQPLSKSTQATSSRKQDASLYLEKSVNIPLRAKKDDLALIRDILKEGQQTPAVNQKQTSKPTTTKPFPPNYVDVLRANTPKPDVSRTKCSTPYGRGRFEPEKLPADSPPAVRPKTAISTSKSRVQSAASSILSDRIKSAPARRRVRTRTAPPAVEKRALIPKTLTTRKGALLLFAAPGDFDLSQPHQKGIFVPTGPPNVSELGTMLGTTKKLTASVLQYGNENFPSDLESFNSQYDKTCMKFVQDDDDEFTLDYRAQPGGDFVFYLRDMQARQMVRSLVRSPSHHSLSSIDTVEELNDALRSIEIEEEVIGYDDDEVRGQRLITADAEKLAETISRPSTVGIDAMSRSNTRIGFSRPSTSKTPAPRSRPGTGTSLCSTPLSFDKIASSIKSAPYLGHPIQAPYPPSAPSIDTYQEETRSGPGSRPKSVNSIRSVTVKSRKSSAASSILKRPASGISASGCLKPSNHGEHEGDDDYEQGSVAITEGAILEQDIEGSQRSASRAASSHHDSWPDGGSDADGEVLVEGAEDASRPASSRRSRHSSARRSASLKERSRSHISVADVEETEEAELVEEDVKIPSRQPSARSTKSVAMAIDEGDAGEEEGEEMTWPDAAGDADGAHSSHYGSRPVSHRSQYSYASASTSIPMGSEPDLAFPQEDEQHMEEPPSKQQPEDVPQDNTPRAVTPKVVTPKPVTPQEQKPETPRPPSIPHPKTPSVKSEHPPEDTEPVADPEEADGIEAEAAPSEEDVDAVVEEVMDEVVAEADEAQDEVLIDVPKGPRMSVSDAQSDIARALRRHSQNSSSASAAPISESEEDDAFSPPEPPATVAPLPTPAKTTAPSLAKAPAVPKQRVMVAATPVKAKSRSPSPTAKASPPVEKKSTGLDLSSLVSKGKTQSSRVPPPKKEKKGRKKGGGGGKVRQRSPPPFKMEFVDSVVVEKFEEPTAEEFEKMLQEELAQELAANNMADLMKKEEEEKAKEEAEEVNSLATDGDAIEQQIEKQMKADTKEGKGGGKKKNIKKQMAKEKAALKEQRRQEKMRREEEKRELAEKKKQIEVEKRRQEEADRRRREDLAEQLADAEEEARRAAEAEEEARQMLQEARRLAKEEREAKRKAEIEKKKIERERQRESRKKMEEAAREREREMAERLASAAERKKMREDAEYERLEQERMEREQREFEEEEEKLRLQEEEEKIRELEKQAEEEAMQRLIKEREEANAKRKEAMKEANRMKQEEEKKRQEELKKQAEEEERKRLEQLEEDRKIKLEMERVAKLKLMEEHARDRVRRKIESRRQYLLKVRDKNRERRMHLNSVRQTQGMTRPWVFSYYVHWSRDTYERRLPSKKKETRRMKPKPPPKPPEDEAPKMANTGAQ